MRHYRRSGNGLPPAGNRQSGQICGQEPEWVAFDTGWKDGRKPSASGGASRNAEIARIKGMTVRERMALALALGRRQRALVERLKQGSSGDRNE